ncbi:LysR family transcriptional regulator [Hoeflea marina]|uniref:LysR family transcriptional regulator n=1 Tax=Hoeflea marina TaxID=274592 RepID=A0A317PIG8_9HYPH|nr:LysR family transcriptional regulator [Hoeflea marina]PWV97189.1 LysR family transcriptional regulator [Hoeflea marina]
MEMHQIRYFLMACETLNFTRAAQRCEVSVPSLTRAIQALEDEFGGQLFRRERSLTHLTDLGRLMRQHLGAAREATEAARRDARRYADADTALKLGVVATMPARHLTGYLRTLGEAASELRLHVWEANCEELTEALRHGEIDIAISTAANFDDWMRPTPLFRERYMVAFPPGHRFEQMNAVPLSEFEGEAYVKRLHCEFPSNFARLDIARPYQTVEIRYVGEREDWVQAMVNAALGITVMPEFLPMQNGIQTRLVVEPEVYRQVSLVTVAGRPHSRPVALAVRTARSFPWQSIGGQ